MLKTLPCPSAAKSYDVIIVGSGLSGCLAARHVLRKKPNTKIAIIEEGSSPVKGLMEAPFCAPYLPLLPWTKGMCSSYSRNNGSVIGGSCAISEGPLLVRGLKEEYERIAERLAATKFGQYQTYFDSYLAHGQPQTGDDAKVPVSFPSLRQLNSEINAKFQQACYAAGLRPISDEKGNCDGFGPTQALLLGGKRFQPTQILRHFNVDLYSQTLAHALELNGDSVQGVLVRSSSSRSAKDTLLSAGAVVLCAGGIGTPSLLLRSGVGPASLLNDKCRCNIEALGQSVIEAPQLQISFKIKPPHMGKSVNLLNLHQIHKAIRDYKTDHSGPLSSFAEWQAFVRSNDDLQLPNCRLTLSTAFANGMPTLNQEGFTINMVLTGTEERGKIVPLNTSSARDEIQYQYSYCGTEANLKALDEIVLWATMLCDSSSNIKFAIGNEHPFSQMQASAAPPDLATPETTREFIRAMVTGSGDVYGACPMGSVTDANTLQVVGLRNLSIGDVSVVPQPMMANKFALGVVTACMVAEAL